MTLVYPLLLFHVFDHYNRKSYIFDHNQMMGQCRTNVGRSGRVSDTGVCCYVRSWDLDFEYSFFSIHSHDYAAGKCERQLCTNILSRIVDGYNMHFSGSEDYFYTYAISLWPKMSIYRPMAQIGNSFQAHRTSTKLTTIRHIWVLSYQLLPTILNFQVLISLQSWMWLPSALHSSDVFPSS